MCSWATRGTLPSWISSTSPLERRAPADEQTGASVDWTRHSMPPPPAATVIRPPPEQVRRPPTSAAAGASDALVDELRRLLRCDEEHTRGDVLVHAQQPVDPLVAAVRSLPPLASASVPELTAAGSPGELWSPDGRRKRSASDVDCPERLQVPPLSESSSTSTWFFDVR